MIDLQTFRVSTVKALGTPPGWIYKHKATLSSNGATIFVENGQVIRGADRMTADNIDDWCLHLADWRLERLTDHRWPQWEVRRKDGKPNHLLLYESVVMPQAVPGMEKRMTAINRQLGTSSLAEELGGAPDLKTCAQFYQPPVAHEQCSPSEEGDVVHCIKVAGVVVRYREDPDSVHVAIEGNLPRNILDALGKDLAGKMTKVEHTACELIKLP